jgi:hypothetical protein
LDLGDLGTLVRIAPKRVFKFNRLRLGSEALEKLIIDARLYKDTRAGTAALPVVHAKKDGSMSGKILQSREYILDAVGGPIDGKLEICVIEHDIR